MWLATLLMALRALRRNVLRSALTMLGIVIGVASVIAMVTLGQSATASVRNNIASLGTNMLIAVPGADRRGPVSTSAINFKADDIRALRQELTDIGGMAPTSSKGVLVVYGSANYSTTVQGSTNEFFRVRNYRIAKGRDFSDTEISGAATVCVLGETVKRQVFGSQDPLGAVMRVGKVACMVIGVLESKGQSSFGPDQDDLLVMPLAAVQRRLIGDTDIHAVYLTVADESALNRTKLQVQGILRERRHIQPGQKDDFEVQDTREIAKTMGNVTGILTALLGAVAGVSLLVGGIGIMNIMLVSVTERTREIGTRLAIGALAREVLAQFLVEAVLLCVLGGTIGIALGLFGSWAATRVLSMPFAVDYMIVLVAFVFSGVIGVVFGFVPARRAARLNPIEALRHE
jgi:putative ABC transport system permease protein